MSAKGSTRGSITAIANVSLAATSLLVGLLLAEGILRLTARFPIEGLHSVSERDYRRIPGMWEPGQELISREKPALPYQVRINALGLRGLDTTIEPSGPRVLFVGDSLTFGDFVEDGETLPRQVQQRLREAEVLNGGVGGTTITDQRVFLERYLALRPHVVVLVFFENDLSDLFMDPPRHVVFARNRAAKSGALYPFYRLVRDTALFNGFLKVQARMRRRPGWGPEEKRASHPPKWLAKAVAMYAAEVVKVRELLEPRGIALVIAAYPEHYNVANLGEGPKYETIGPVSTALRDLGIAVVDLTIPLRESHLPVADLYLLPHDGHPSPIGYAVAADALTPHVRAALLEQQATSK